jgi:hypothetical protein
LKFDVLDEQKSGKKSNKARNPNAQKVNACLPNPFGQVFVVNAEKVILESFKFNAQTELELEEVEKDTNNDLKRLFGQIENRFEIVAKGIRAREGIFNPQFTANTIPTTRVTTSTSTGSASTYSNPSTITVGGLIVNNGVTTNTLTVSSTSTFNGSIIYGAVLISSTYTILSTDYLVGVNTSTSTCSITLPSVSTTTAGRTLVIKDETGNATANPIHISASSGEAIDGLSVFTIDSDHGAITLYCTSTGWHVT